MYCSSTIFSINIFPSTLDILYPGCYNISCSRQTDLLCWLSRLEHRVHIAGVAGSSPARSTISGALAQLARALHWQCRGHGFESHMLHQAPFFGKVLFSIIRIAQSLVISRVGGLQGQDADILNTENRGWAKPSRVPDSVILNILGGF